MTKEEQVMLENKELRICLAALLKLAEKWHRALNSEAREKPAQQFLKEENELKALIIEARRKVMG